MQTHEKETKANTEEKKIIERPLAIWPRGLTISDESRLSISVANDLAILMTTHAFQQLFGWAYSTSREISCLGSIRREGNVFVVEEFYMLEQSSSSASTEINEEAIAKFMEQLLAEGRMDQMAKIKCWAHSHPGMGVFWSGTDGDTCRLLVNDYLISLVVSDDFEVLGRIDITAPVPITLNHVPVFYDLPQDDQLKIACSEQVRAAVSERFCTFEDIGSAKTGSSVEIASGLHCGYCGTYHLEGACPLDDPATMRSIIDDEGSHFRKGNCHERSQ